MSELLTRDEYAAIDGGFRKAKSEKTFPTINPANGETLAEVAA